MLGELLEPLGGDLLGEVLAWKLLGELPVSAQAGELKVEYQLGEVLGGLLGELDEESPPHAPQVFLQ
jgi:hypothetical protein